MNDEITEIVKNVSSIQKIIQEQVQSFITQFREAFTISPEILEGIRLSFKALEAWPEWQKEYWLKASKFGWYFNCHTPASSCLEAANKGKESLDEFMSYHLKHDWTQITSQIIELCPSRREILQEAFLLHSEERYIASIPLLLSQIDGICAEYLGAFLFSEHDMRLCKIERHLELNNNKALDLFLSLLKNKNQYSNSIGKNSPIHKDKAPNRNGILHGSRKHLDYGTKINSLKCFSLLAFVVFALVESEMPKNT